MSKPLTSDQAMALLRDPASSKNSAETLRALAAQVDADSRGHLTLLYSGSLDDPRVEDLANSMQEASESPSQSHALQRVGFSNLRHHFPSPIDSR